MHRRFAVEGSDFLALVRLWDHLREPALRRYGGPGSGIYRSNDGGTTWQLLAGGLPQFWWIETVGLACLWAAAALTLLKRAGATGIRIVCLVAAPEGIQAVHAQHPEIPIYVAAIDRQLNESGYILPGLGDAGDRTFGT